MNKTAVRIRRLREEKGFSQEFVAEELGISQASYARMENGHSKVTVDRLYKLAEILEVDVSDFFQSPKISIENQIFQKEHSNGYVENLHFENKETVAKLLASKDMRIGELKEEVNFLRKLVNNSTSNKNAAT